MSRRWHGRASRNGSRGREGIRGSGDGGAPAHADRSENLHRCTSGTEGTSAHGAALDSRHEAGELFRAVQPTHEQDQPAGPDEGAQPGDLFRRWRPSRFFQFA